MPETFDLLVDLIRCPSVTPEDAGCQDILARWFAPLDFRIERMRFGAVDNLWVRRGEARPLLVFAGHTDVVPPGPLDAWSSPPFVPEVRNGVLYGRGAADMKGSLAAMATACRRFLARRPEHVGSLALLITSDEEGVATDGTARVMDTLVDRGEVIDYCLVGEPTSETRLGDVMKVGRRGSFHGHLRVATHAGADSAAIQSGDALGRTLGALAELCAQTWDEGTAHFPPTSFQVTNLNQPAPGEALTGHFNFRFSPALSHDDLRERVTAVLARHGLSEDVDWSLSGVPFITEPGPLTEAVAASVQAVTGLTVRAATSGGTSDGRFIAPTGAQVVELGPLNDSIHQIDEHLRVADLEPLSGIYEGIMERLLPAVGT